MFFVISKILAFLLNPVIWVIVLILWALLAKNARKKKRLLIITLCLTYFFSNSFIISEVYRLWEVQPVKLEQLDTCDVGVVLGGGMITYDSRYDRHIFRGNTDRIMQAVYLYREKHIKKILISGGSGSLIFRDMREAVFLNDFLVKTLQIPQEDILTDTTSDNTYQNAVESARIIKEHFINPKVMLITSAFHMRRSKMCFKKQGIDVVLYSTDLTAGPRRFQFDHLFMPTLQSLIQWNKFWHEIIGIITYKLMGYA